MIHTRTPTTPENLSCRFWEKVLFEPNGCWEWNASKSPAGYGQIRFGNRLYLAHRVAYELEVGEIPSGLQIDHLCRNRACVNPAHLEVVTQQENILRGEGASAQHARKTHCPQGHPYSEENTFFEAKPNGRVGRRCRICNSEKSHQRYLERSEAMVKRRNASHRIGMVS